MIEYRRTPATAILLLVLSTGWVASFSNPGPGAPRGAAGFRRGGDPTLAELEIAIASERATADDWFAYAERLRSGQQHQDAALAYAKALELQPYNQEARFRCALSLAASGSAEEFYRFMQDLACNHAKLAVDLFARPESQPYLAQERFRALAQEAQNQAMD